MKSIKRIHIFGASGSGVSTLGKSLSDRMKVKSFDSDDFYWKRTDPPFIEAEPLEIREKRYLNELSKFDEWICAGSLVSWGNEIKKLFDLAIYLYVPSDVRLERLRKREKQNFCERIMQGGDMYEYHLKFLEWADGYDKGELNGRSLKKHRSWMKSLDCPVIKFEGEFEIDELALSVHRQIIDIELKQLVGKVLNIHIDRPIGSIHPKHPNILYEINYGFVPNTLSLDGHEIDAYVLDEDQAIESCEGKCIGYIKREDDDDPKLLITTKGSSFSEEEILEKVNFQERFFTPVVFRG